MLDRSLRTIFFSVLVLAPALLLAQEEPPPPPAGTLFVEQKSEIDAHGTWTLILPNHESFNRTDKSLTVPDLMPGRYTFMSEAPKGTAASVDVFLGDDVIVHADTPQITFELKDKMTLKLVIEYKLTVYGKIGVNSSPLGVPFELQGPDGFFRPGVTPVEFPKMPIGNYSVRYKPDGCNEPPATSGILTQDKRIDFMIELVCSSFKPVLSETAKNVTTEVGNISITFTDVPADAWFGPYVATVAKLNVMAGYTGANGQLTGTFGPGDNVTVAQLAKVVHTLMKIDEKIAGGAAPRNPQASGQWYTRYISSAEELGWIVYVDGTVDPNRPATRGEVLATLLQALDIPMHWPKGTVFTDVLRKTPYSGAIETGAAEGIVSGATGADGEPTGEFLPNTPITRAEMAKIAITVREKYQRNKSSSSSAGL